MDNTDHLNKIQHNYIKDKLFQYKLFKHLQKEFFKSTPESDSLYRRRNKLILFSMSLIGYSFTHNWVNDYKLLISKRWIKLLSIPIMKLSLLSLWIISFQLALKYIYYLNKVYKSYQFGLEGVLKYNILNRSYSLENKTSRDKSLYTYSNDFDLIDSTNIKKNQ